MTISTFSLGTLAIGVFHLGLRDAILTIVFFNLLSTIPVSYFSIFGARTGLRQMVFSRYSFGCAYISGSFNFRAPPCPLSSLGGETKGSALMTSCFAYARGIRLLT